VGGCVSITNSYQSAFSPLATHPPPAGIVSQARVRARMTACTCTDSNGQPILADYASKCVCAFTPWSPPAAKATPTTIEEMEEEKEEALVAAQAAVTG